MRKHKVLEGNRKTTITLNGDSINALYDKLNEVQKEFSDVKMNDLIKLLCMVDIEILKTLKPFYFA